MQRLGNHGRTDVLLSTSIISLLSDQLDDPEDSYPCHMAGIEEDLTIKKSLEG